MNAILRIQGLSKSFGTLVAVDHVELAVTAGEFLAVIGPNGAGKTTLFNLVTGTLRPDAGRVFLKDTNITGRAPRVIVHAGLARTFQITSVFPDLTVLENVLVSCFAHARRSIRLWSPYAEEREAGRRARSLLGELGIEHLADQRCGALSHADQKLVEVGMALATAPGVLLLDEPTSGLSPEETGQITALLRRLAEAQHATVVLIEHDMDVVFSVAQRIVVLHQGQVIADGPPATVRADATVKEVYLGGRFAERA